MVVIGDTDAARLVCTSLAASDEELVHLLNPSEDHIRSSFPSDTEAVAIVVRGDIVALRYALLVEHLHPGVRLLVAIFDRTLAAQLIRAMPKCEILSPADIAIPSITAACVGWTGPTPADAGAADRTTGPRGRSDGRRRLRPAQVARRLGEQLRPHDGASRLMISGLLGLSIVLITSIVLSMVALHRGFIDALASASQIVATVGPSDATSSVPGWYATFSSVTVLLTVGLTASFTAGLVNWMLSPRSFGLIGRRTIPRRGHIVIVGLGQVGLRLALSLRQLGHRVAVVEQNPAAANLRFARRAGLPVVIGHAEDRAVLRRLGLRRARCLAAMSSEELDNVEVAITALAEAPSLRIVLRAGEDDVIAETRSLFRIGQVCDVSRLTADSVHRWLCGHGGSSSEAGPVVERCRC